MDTSHMSILSFMSYQFIIPKDFFTAVQSDNDIETKNNAGFKRENDIYIYICIYEVI